MRRFQTRTGLADSYGIHRETVSKWLREIGITHRGGLAPLDVEIFIKKYGTPESLRRSAELLGKS